jgi:hypothetical protein
MYFSFQYPSWLLIWAIMNTVMNFRAKHFPDQLTNWQRFQKDSARVNSIYILLENVYFPVERSRYGAQVELSQQGLECRIWGTPSGGHEEFYILECNAAYPVHCRSTFRRNISPPSSRSKNN